MSKKIALSLALAAAVALMVGTGLWRFAGVFLRPEPQPLAGAPSRDGSSPRLDRALSELRALRADRDALALANRRLEDDLLGLKRAMEPASGASPGAKAEVPGLPSASGIRWTDYATVLAGCVELLGKVQANQRLTDEEQAQLDLLQAELRKISAQARTITPRPLLDPAVFGELTIALFKDPLKLRADQLGRLRELCAGIFAELPEDPGSLPALDQFRMRRDMLARLRGGMEAMIEEGQMEDWPIINRYLDEVFQYGGRMEVATSTNPHSFLNTWLANSLPSRSSQQALIETLKPIAEGYMQEAAGLLDRYAPDGQDPRSLPPDRREELNSEMLKLQERFQEQAAPHLSDEQRQMLREKSPIVIRFQRSDGLSVIGRWGPF